MIIIIYGDNTAESRNKFADLKAEYRAKKYLIIDITKDKLSDIPKWLYESQGLFEDQKVFFSENILSKKEQREYITQFDSTESQHTIVIWEENLDDRAVKRYFKNARLIACKMPTSIFTLLDALYPGNKAGALSMLVNSSDAIEEHLMLYMFQRRMRELVLMKHSITPTSTSQAWQLSRLSAQARRWDTDKLLSCYDALYRIERNAKSAATPYSIREALDILLVYYL